MFVLWFWKNGVWYDLHSNDIVYLWETSSLYDDWSLEHLPTGIIIASGGLVVCILSMRGL